MKKYLMVAVAAAALSLGSLATSGEASAKGFKGGFHGGHAAIITATVGMATAGTGPTATTTTARATGCTGRTARSKSARPTTNRRNMGQMDPPRALTGAGLLFLAPHPQ